MLTFPLGDVWPDQPTIYVQGDHTALDASRPRLEVVAAQASASLNRIRLAQEVIRRANQDYFRALVANCGRRHPDGRRRRQGQPREPVRHEHSGHVAG